MKVHLTTFTGHFVTMDVSPDIEIENFKALCEVECEIPSAECFISHNGVPLLDEKKTIAMYGVKEDDMLLLERRSITRNHTRGQPQMQGSIPMIDFGGIQLPGSSQQPQTSQPQFRQQVEPDPATLRQMILSNEAQLARLKETNRPLADAINSLEKFTEVLQKQRKAKADEEMHRIRMLSADPFDASAQEQIAEQIRQQNVNDNMEIAIEHMPENFGQVIMLYIDCKVNGHPVKAFVDSGAQMTIMSQACAERCNIMRLVDKRWEGIAKGVGTQKIIGRVHLGQIEISGVFLHTSFTILENQPMDMLLGLDMLKRHQCCIDLKENKLQIGTSGSETPFLSESDLPPCARLNKQEGPESEDRQLAEALARSTEETAAGPSNANQSNSQASATAASNPSLKEEDVKKLVDMGFQRDDAIRELTSSNGNWDVAVAKLIAKSLKAPGQQ